MSASQSESRSIGMPLTTAELKTLDRLLQHALDLPEAERSRWLDTLPPEDATLAAILRAQLDAPALGKETAELLGELPRLPLAAEGAWAEHEAGERVGPYRLVRPLGKGGMGTVWLAGRADGAMTREVALKLPHRHLLDRGLIERMGRERDILAALNHDHIARLYEAGIDEHGTPYLALEHVEGTPIDVYCAAHKLGLEARVKLLLQVAQAVAHAHASLVVHRDLKPRNVLVSVVDDAPRVKLLDFGVAKLLAPTTDADLTRFLGAALTPDYASPEQLLDQQITTATDVYSLGVLMYEIVTGEKPYRLARQAPGALAEAIANAVIVRPSRRLATRGMRREAQRAGSDLDAVILKALRPDPRERYPTAAALTEDLERFLAHRPVLAQPDRWSYRARRFVRRNAVAVGAGSAIALALVAGTTIALWQAREARLEVAKTRAVKDFLVEILSAGVVGNESAGAPSKRPVGEVLTDAARTLPTKLAGQPEVREELEETLGHLLETLTLSQAAVGVHEARLRDLEARNAPLVTRMAARNALAYSLGGAGDKARAVALYDEVIAALDGATGSEATEALAWAFTHRAMMRNEIAGGKGAVEDATRAVRLRESADRDGTGLIYALIALGAAQTAAGQVAEADAALTRALPLARALKGKDAAIEATAQSHLARSLFARREYVRAEEHALRALEVIERHSGKESFVWARNAIYPGVVGGLRGDAARAELYLGHAAQLFAGMGADISPEFASGVRSLHAKAMLDYGSVDRALALAKDAYAPYAKATQPGPFPFPSMRARYGLAEVLQAQGRYKEAQVLLDEAIALAASPGHARTPHGFQARRIAAVNALRMGDARAAQAALEAIIVEDTNPNERFGAWRHFARIDLATVLLESGQVERAAAELGDLDKLMAGLKDDERATSGVPAAQVAALQGHLELRRSNPAAAVGHFSRVLDLLATRQDPRSPFLAKARGDLARAQKMSGF
jgi:serine/threonine-protein kinase